MLFGLWGFYEVRGDFQTARELAEQLLSLAQRQDDSALLLQGHRALGDTLYWLGEFALSRIHLEQGIALYDPEQHRAHAFLYGQDPGMGCLVYAALTFWSLGYPDRALHLSHEAIALTQGVAHPFSLAFALNHAGRLHLLRREWQMVQERVEAVIALATEHGFAHFLISGAALRRRSALLGQGQVEEGIAQRYQSLSSSQTAGIGMGRPEGFTELARAYGGMGRPEGLPS